jgi:hypothetical protein
MDAALSRLFDHGPRFVHEIKLMPSRLLVHYTADENRRFFTFAALEAVEERRWSAWGLGKRA